MTDETRNPYRPPASQSAPARNSAKAWEIRQRFVLVAALYLVIAVGYVVAVLRPEAVSVIRLVVSAAVATMAAYWCVVDSRVRGSPIVQSLHWIIFFTWPIAVPIYLVWSRRWWGLGLALAHGIGIYAVCLAAYHLTGYLVYGAQWSAMFHR